MHQTPGAYPYPRDWHNHHYDNRRPWLVSPWPEPKRQHRSWRPARLLATLAGLVGSLPPEWRPQRTRSSS